MTDYVLFLFFFFKQKTAYEMRISDWSSDVCSSDLSRVSSESSPPNPGPSPAPDPVPGPNPAVARDSLIRVPSSEAALVVKVRPRSEERRVGKECVSTCRSRWSPYR